MKIFLPIDSDRDKSSDSTAVDRARTRNRAHVLKKKQLHYLNSKSASVMNWLTDVDSETFKYFTFNFYQWMWAQRWAWLNFRLLGRKCRNQIALSQDVMVWLTLRIKMKMSTSSEFTEASSTTYGRFSRSTWVIVRANSTHSRRQAAASVRTMFRLFWNELVVVNVKVDRKYWHPFPRTLT